LIFIFWAIAIIILDQVTKYAAVKYLMGQSPYVIIMNHLEFRYVENYGAAFGILQGKRVFFIIIATIVILLVVFYLYKNYNNFTLIAKFAVFTLLGGAIGNLIDRVRLGYVIDFIRVSLLKSYDFPVFNIADTFIVIGTILIVYVVLFDKYEA